MRYALLQPEPRTWVAVLQEHGAFFLCLTAMCWNRAFRFSCGLRAKDRGWFYRLASFLCFRRNVYRSCAMLRTSVRLRDETRSERKDDLGPAISGTNPLLALEHFGRHVRPHIVF